MRRLDLHPRRRLRNPGRHLRSLARWPERIVAQLPTNMQLEGAQFWNFKIPAYAKPLDPPHVRDEWRCAALSALFAAAEAVERSSARPRNTRVAVLATTPCLFESEVTLFADEAYFRSFLPQAKASRTEWEGGWVEGRPATGAELPRWAPAPPAGLDLHGGAVITEMEYGASGGAAAEPHSRTLWVWSFPRA